MALSAPNKQDILQEHQQHGTDTGSTEVQIALLTARINYLTQHVTANSKDFSARRGLLQLVGRRRRLLRYYRSRHTAEQYKALIDRHNIRK